jgi:hypothetical protein
MMASGEPARRRADFLSLQEGRSAVFAVVDYAYDTDKARWCEITLRYRTYLACFLLVLYMILKRDRPARQLLP